MIGQSGLCHSGDIKLKRRILELENCLHQLITQTATTPTPDTECATHLNPFSLIVLALVARGSIAHSTFSSRTRRSITCEESNHVRVNVIRDRQHIERSARCGLCKPVFVLSCHLVLDSVTSSVTQTALSWESCTLSPPPPTRALSSFKLPQEIDYSYNAVR